MKHIGLLSLSLFVVMPAHAAPTYVGQDAFAQAVVGKTIASTTKKGAPFTAVIAKGGKGTFEAQGAKAMAFKWDFKGDTFCWHFKDFSECNKVEVVGPTDVNFYDAKSGALNNAYKVR